MKDNNQIYDLHLIRKYPKEMAKKYSEENIFLEKLLNASYEKGLMTFACCKGHPGTKYNCPYIGYLIQVKDDLPRYENIIYLATKMLDKCYIYLSKQNGDIKLAIYFDKIRKNRDEIDKAYSCLATEILKENINDNKINYLEIYDYITKGVKDANSSKNFTMCIDSSGITFVITENDDLAEIEKRFLRYLENNYECKYVKDEFYTYKHFLIEEHDVIRIMKEFMHK